jgi:NAD(P)-dependent dehydrogenase (short-subunit alcohol dehydrogenase family)
MNEINFTLVTGAGGFLGPHHCVSVLENGNSLIMVDKDQESLKKVFKYLNKKFPKKKIYYFKCDITKEKQVKIISKKIKKKNLSIDSIINNAAIDAVPKRKGKILEFIEVEQWHKELNVSLLGNYLITKYFVEFLKKNKSSSVVNIGSDLSVIAPNQKIYKETFGDYIKPVTYSVVKHGLVGLTKYYASLFAKNNIRFNMISPGPVYKNQNKKFLNELKKIIPMNRMGLPKDLAGAVKFLLSKESSFVTGQNLLIDGGRTII